MTGSVRVDVWLWAVRVFKTRSAANTACTAGAVRIDGVVAKPSRAVTPGARVDVRVRGRTRELEVLDTPSKRVGAAVAATAFIDHSPPPEPAPLRPAPVAQRERGSGRPTKRDRRKLDDFRQGDVPTE